jgi:cold shock protein
MGERQREGEWHGSDRRRTAPQTPKPQVGEVCKGIVKRLVTDKGFGFVEAKNAQGWDFFFHRSSVTRGSFDLLNAGDEVQFTVADSPKGPRAEDVRVL